MSSDTQLPQWRPSSSGPPSPSRADALRNENRFSGGGGPAPGGGGGAGAYAPPKPSALQRLWRGFWFAFFLSIICGTLGVVVNTNLKLRSMADDLAASAACTPAVADANTVVLGLPPPLESATWADLLASVKARARLRRCATALHGAKKTQLCCLISHTHTHLALPQAKSTVRFASWSDADYGNVINDYIDQRLATTLRSDFGVQLRRVPLNATKDAVDSVWRADAAGVPGTIDLIWINGGNFKARTQARGAGGARGACVKAFRTHAARCARFAWLLPPLTRARPPAARTHAQHALRPALAAGTAADTPSHQTHTKRIAELVGGGSPVRPVCDAPAQQRAL
jgi:hypothetical protein